MDRVLSEFRVGGPGVATTIGFLREVLAFRRSAMASTRPRWSTRCSPAPS